jgi:hypothetical protein
LTVWPQLLIALPHTWPAQVLASGSSVQPHTSGVPPPPHVFGEVHVPHETWTPQLLITVPQFLPWQAVPSSVQPHTLATPPPPHVFGAAHVPHDTGMPQLLVTVPQFLP